jgi:hypothetical protein
VYVGHILLVGNNLEQIQKFNSTFLQKTEFPPSFTAPSSFQLLREEGRTSFLPSSLALSFSMNIFVFVAFSLKVFLALSTSHEDLSIVSYDLACSAMQSQGLGFYTVPVSSSSMFDDFFPVLVSSF